MQLFETERSYIVPTVFRPSDIGMYSIYPPDHERCFSSYWDTCREQFAKKFLNDSLGFFFSCDSECLEAPVKFIINCEKLLQIRFSKFYTTDMNNVVFIKPSPFWKQCYMRRSLFTMLCRQGIFYKEKIKFEYFLFGEMEETKKEKVDSAYAFARKTKPAIIRFFGGYTKYIGTGPDLREYFPEKHGWVEEFKEKDLNYIKSVLINKDYYFFMPKSPFLN